MTPIWDTGFRLADYWPLFGQWSANSQYGYTLAWFNTELEAVEHSRNYYRTYPYPDFAPTEIIENNT